MKKREVKSQKQEQNGHKKGARNKRGGTAINRRGTDFDIG